MVDVGQHGRLEEAPGALARVTAGGDAGTRSARLLDVCGDDVELLDTAPDVLAYRRGPLTVVLNAASEAVQVPVAWAATLLEATAEGAELADGVVTVPAAATVWLVAGPEQL